MRKLRQGMDSLLKTSRLMCSVLRLQQVKMVMMTMTNVMVMVMVMPIFEQSHSPTDGLENRLSENYI